MLIYIINSVCYHKYRQYIYKGGIHMEIKGKVALITGGGTGVGKGVALRLAKEGTNICINYAHSEKEAYEAKAEVDALGVK